MEVVLYILDLAEELIKIFCDKITLLFGAILSLIFYLTGGENELLSFLCYAMVIDYVSGIIKSFITKKMNSRTGIKGILKKSMMILVIAAVNILDTVLQAPVEFKTIIISLFLSNEILSVLENAILSGIPIPDCIKRELEKRLEQYQNSIKK